MKKRVHLYLVAAATSVVIPTASNVIPIISASTPRERSWRELVRRLEKNPQPGPLPERIR